MKRILILAILLMSSLAWAGSTTVVVGQGGEAPPSKVAYDDFTDDDSTELSSHTSDSSHTWTKQAGSNLVITDNHVRAASSAEGGFYCLSYEPTSANYSVKATYKVAVASNVTPMLGGRCSTSATTGYGVRFGDGVWRLYSVVSGTETGIGSYEGDVPTSETVVELSMVGTTISVIIAGTTRISVTSSTITAAGRPGIGSYYSDTDTYRYIDTYEVWQ